MTFRPIEQRVVAATKKPASIVLSPRGEGDLPMCRISLRGFFAETTKWKMGDEIAVQLGEGDDAGKLRIARGVKPVIGRARVLKRGGIAFDLGHIAALNEGKSCNLIPIDARMVDKDTIELVLPTDWGGEGVQDEAEDETEPEIPAKPAPPRPPVTPRAAKAGALPNKTGAAEPPVTYAGVTIDFQPGDESVVYGGKLMEVTARQAQFMALLARVMPQPVGRDFIKKKLQLDGSLAGVTLDQIAMDLSKALPGIGLALHNQKGIGFGLKVKG